MALRGTRVVEVAGLAPAPFCGMILSDFGADVIRVDKPVPPTMEDTLCRGKRSIVINLHLPQGVKVFKRLCKSCDVLIEPYRAGTMEQLQLGPSILCAENPRLIYARLNGFGQEGPYSKMAGHDINFIATSGVLSTFGPYGQKPAFPINLLGGFGGGGLMCALGICLALLEQSRTGRGQVIDANMVEGAAYLGSWLWTSRLITTIPLWTQERGRNLLDGGAPFYQTYRTKDGKFMAVGAVERPVYVQFLKGLGLNARDYPQMDNWEKNAEDFAAIFASKTQQEWCIVFDQTDACVTPVLPLDKAHEHSHNAARNSFYKHKEHHFPKPAPILSKTPAVVSPKWPKIGEHTEEIMTEFGYTEIEILTLKAEKVVYTQSDL